LLACDKLRIYKGFLPFRSHNEEQLTLSVPTNLMVVSLRANLNAGVQLLKGLHYHGSPLSRISLVSKNICILAFVPAELLVKRQPHIHLSTCFNRHATIPSHCGLSGYDNRVKRYTPACTGFNFRFLHYTLHLPWLRALSLIAQLLIARSCGTRKRPIQA